MTDEYRGGEAYEKRAAVCVFISMMLAVLPSIFLGTIRCMTPTFHDHLEIRNEFKYILRTIGAVFLVIVICTGIYIAVEPDWLENVFIGAAYFFICFGAFSVQSISTKWVLKTLKLNSMGLQLIDLNVNDIDSVQASNNIMLKNIFLNKDLFYEFVAHVRHEFSLEILLSFYDVSFVQV